MALYPFTTPESIGGAGHSAFEGASSMWQALNTDDGQTFGANLNGTGTGTSSCTLAESAEAAVYRITFQARTLGVPTTGITFRFGLTNSAGNRAWGATLQCNSVDADPGDTYTYDIDLTDPQDTGHAVDSLFLETNNPGSADGTYFLIDLLTIALAATEFTQAGAASLTLTGATANDVARSLAGAASLTLTGATAKVRAFVRAFGTSLTLTGAKSSVHTVGLQPPSTSYFFGWMLGPIKESLGSRGISKEKENRKEEPTPSAPPTRFGRRMKF